MTEKTPPAEASTSSGSPNGQGGAGRAILALLAALITTVLRVTWRGLRRGALGLLASWRRQDGRRRWLTALSVVTVALLPLAWHWRDVPYHWSEALAGRRPLLAAKSWFYNLQKIDIDNVARQPADLVVIDYARGDSAATALTPAEVDRMRIKPDGGRRLVVSYFSIGEAESYRFYWKKDWENDPPGWYVAENCAWPRNYMVRFWHDGWRDIIYRGADSYLKRIIAAGMDGVYLDRIDVYENLLSERPSARQDMIGFVTELAAKARELKPGFLVIAQNAEGLLKDRAYRSVIDGLGKEDLLYGGHASNIRNPQSEVAPLVRLIRRLQWDWKPVFAVEYLSDPALISEAKDELLRLGLVPTFAHKALDGLDPTMPRPPSTMPYGTPEWVAKNCQGKPHW